MTKKVYYEASDHHCFGAGCIFCTNIRREKKELAKQGVELVVRPAKPQPVTLKNTVREGLTLVAIQDWVAYLESWMGWDRDGYPFTKNPLPKGAVVEPRQKHLTSYHPWSNAENVVVGNEAFLRFLRDRKFRYVTYEQYREAVRS